MDKAQKMVNSQIRIPEKSWEKVKKLASNEKRSINSELIYIIEKYLKENKKEESSYE